MKPTVYAPFLSVMAVAGCSSLYSPNNPQGPAYSTFFEQGDSTTVAGSVRRRYQGSGCDGRLHLRRTTAS